MLRPASVLSLFLFLPACAGVGVGVEEKRDGISEVLVERTGHGLGPHGAPGETAIPDAVSLEDGISEDEAVALALWNNATFQEALENLGFARADVVEAGLLPNPTLSVLFPLDSKQLEFAATFPIEALWLRFLRVDLAEHEYARVAIGLMQSGLDVARDARLDHAAAVLAKQRAAFAAEQAGVANATAEFFETKFRAGDVSELEARLAGIDALESRREATAAVREVERAHQKLRETIGLIDDSLPLTVTASDTAAPPPDLDLEALRELALASRPDLRAAKMAIDSAGEKAGLARWEYLQISGIIDANDREGSKGLEVGPGIDAVIPIFNFNQGTRARAEAEIKRAARRYVALRHQIAREVGESLAVYQQAHGEHKAWRWEILPSIETAVERARKALGSGHTSRLPVLQAERRLALARTQAAVAQAALRRARASLERSVGTRLNGGE